MTTSRVPQEKTYKSHQNRKQRIRNLMRLNREWLKSKDTNVTVARTACWNMCSTEGDKQYMFLNLMSLATEMCKTTKEPWAACMRAVLRQWLKERSNATNHDKASNV